MSGLENRVKRRVKHIETAGQCAKCRQDQSRGVFDKTSPPHHPTALAYARAWMQVSGNFAALKARAVARQRFVAKMQTSVGAHIKALARRTIKTRRRGRVVVAQHPNGFNLSAEADKARRIGFRHALLPANIVKTVAQRHQKARGETLKAGLQTVQRFRRVIGRQGHPARGIGRGFLQMLVIHNQRARGRPIDRARHIADQARAINTKLCALFCALFCHLFSHLSARWPP